MNLIILISSIAYLALTIMLRDKSQLWGFYYIVLFAATASLCKFLTADNEEFKNDRLN